MAELSHEIEFGHAKVPPPSQGTSSAVGKHQLEKELFNVEGILADSGCLYFIDLL